MFFEFASMKFVIEENRIFLVKYGAFQQGETDPLPAFNFVEVHIAGEHKNLPFGTKLGISSEGQELRYVSHSITAHELVIVQRSNRVETKSIFISYPDTKTIRTYTEVKNITNGHITLEEVSVFKGMNFGRIENSKDIYLYKFYQGHHTECQPRKLSMFDLGLIRYAGCGSKRISFANVGSWSTKEELPQAIIEVDGQYIMFQIENNHSWYYEISDDCNKLYLYLSGANQSFGDWKKVLLPGESYTTMTAAITFGNSLNGVIGEMTKYRRHIKGKCEADKHMPTIFNEYMHLSWDSPQEENTKVYAPTVANLGVEYYVIDCGWHNEETTYIYPYVGQWRESSVRFPNGIRATTDYIRSLGMKAGLWIEPEIVGNKCEEMLAYYDDDCFICRDGKKVCTHNRYFLDFRNKKVVDYLTETIRRMVEGYGADYIKLDYNQDLGVGTERDSDSCGEGLEKCSAAYLRWIDMIRAEHPNVIFETCASGGHRLDYATLSHFPIVSTSDQTSYKWYPYIAGNILSSVLPEQAAVWSYPVDSFGGPNEPFNPTYTWVNEKISREQVIMNMINSFLGRMHLASHLELLSEDKQELIKEGISFYNSLTAIKNKALPFLPCGFCNFGDAFVVSGLRTEEEIYLAVWNLGKVKAQTIDLGLEIKEATIVYPKKNALTFTVDGQNLTVEFEEEYQARFFRILY